MEESISMFVKGLVDAITHGGTSAVVSLFLLDLILVIFISFQLVRFIMKFAQAQFKVREDMIKVRETELIDTNKRMQDIMHKMERHQEATADALHRLDMTMSDLNSKFTLMVEIDKLRNRGNQWPS